MGFGALSCSAARSGMTGLGDGLADEAARDGEAGLNKLEYVAPCEGLRS